MANFLLVKQGIQLQVIETIIMSNTSWLKFAQQVGDTMTPQRQRILEQRARQARAQGVNLQGEQNGTLNPSVQPTPITAPTQTPVGPLQNDNLPGPPLAAPDPGLQGAALLAAPETAAAQPNSEPGVSVGDYAPGITHKDYYTDNPNAPRFQYPDQPPTTAMDPSLVEAYRSEYGQGHSVGSPEAGNIPLGETGQMAPGTDIEGWQNHYGNDGRFLGRSQNNSGPTAQSEIGQPISPPASVPPPSSANLGVTNQMPGRPSAMGSTGVAALPPQTSQQPATNNTSLQQVQQQRKQQIAPIVAQQETLAKQIANAFRESGGSFNPRNIKEYISSNIPGVSKWANNYQMLQYQIDGINQGRQEIWPSVQ